MGEVLKVRRLRSDWAAEAASAQMAKALGGGVLVIVGDEPGVGR